MSDLRNAGTVSLVPVDAPELGHLLVIDESASRLVAVPSSGSLVVGRAQECDIILDGAAVSRRHAEIRVCHQGLQVVDLGSHNGTRVGGTDIDGEHDLARGDVIGVGTATIVVYAGRGRGPRWLTRQDFERRLSEEVARCSLHDRPLCVGTLVRPVEKPETQTWPPRPAGVDAGDCLGRLDEDTLAVGLPERTREEAQQLLADLARESGALAGLAVFPSDGIEGSALLDASRAAARDAEPGAVVQAQDRTGVVDVGDAQVVVVDETMSKVMELVRRLATARITVLVSGETGSGKELVARAIHTWSSRRDGPYIAVNCGALTESLLSAELLGYEKGAFTGATATKPGLFEQAHGGTILLDEIGELTAGAQAALLRVLETKAVRRVGGTTEHPVDFRLVAATHRDLQAEVKAGRFRQDLLFRLGSAVVSVPPLRRRRVEIPVLFRWFASRVAAAEGVEPCRLDAAATRALQEYAWPGNVRELANLAELLVVSHPGALLRTPQLPISVVEGGTGNDDELSGPPAQEFAPLAEEIAALEARRMREALDASHGVQTRAAALLGMPRRTFTLKMSRYGLRRTDDHTDRDEP